ncbi:collagen, type I, alpha 1a-like [Melanerpes formicivorus]|uniref:collagen, type I, alpha 1a-like n=1 Tax=Melanerpes formicivorus TaxID=211600 RepID=UPI00358E21F9
MWQESKPQRAATGCPGRLSRTGLEEALGSRCGREVSQADGRSGPFRPDRFRDSVRGCPPPLRPSAPPGAASCPPRTGTAPGPRGSPQPRPGAAAQAPCRSREKPAEAGAAPRQHPEQQAAAAPIPEPPIPEPPPGAPLLIPEPLIPGPPIPEPPPGAPLLIPGPLIPGPLIPGPLIPGPPIPGPPIPEPPIPEPPPGAPPPPSPYGCCKERRPPSAGGSGSAAGGAAAMLRGGSGNARGGSGRPPPACAWPAPGWRPHTAAPGRGAAPRAVSAGPEPEEWSRKGELHGLAAPSHRSIPTLQRGTAMPEQRPRLTPGPSPPTGEGGSRLGAKAGCLHPGPVLLRLNPRLSNGCSGQEVTARRAKRQPSAAPELRASPRQCPFLLEGRRNPSTTFKQGAAFPGGAHAALTAASTDPGTPPEPPGRARHSGAGRRGAAPGDGDGDEAEPRGPTGGEGGMRGRKGHPPAHPERSAKATGALSPPQPRDARGKRKRHLRSRRGGGARQAAAAAAGGRARQPRRGAMQGPARPPGPPPARRAPGTHSHCLRSSRHKAMGDTKEGRRGPERRGRAGRGPQPGRGPARGRRGRARREEEEEEEEEAGSRAGAAPAVPAAADERREETRGATTALTAPARRSGCAPRAGPRLKPPPRPARHRPAPRTRGPAPRRSHGRARPRARSRASSPLGARAGARAPRRRPARGPGRVSSGHREPSRRRSGAAAGGSPARGGQTLPNKAGACPAPRGGSVSVSQPPSRGDRCPARVLLSPTGATPHPLPLPVARAGLRGSLEMPAG